MTVTVKFGIGHLFPEFLADALVILGAFQTAGAIAAGALQAIADGLHHFLIFIEPNCHGVTSFPKSIIRENHPLSRQMPLGFLTGLRLASIMK